LQSALFPQTQGYAPRTAFSPPPFFLGGVLLFWGWQTGLWLLAPWLALLLESPRWIASRWDFSDKEFNRIVDLVSLLCLGVAVYLFAQQSVRGIFQFLIWLPVLLFPLLLAQLYSLHNRVKLRALLLSLRRIGPDHRLYQQSLDLGYAYALTCLISASVARHEWFFAGLCAFTAWGLWPARSPRYALALWALLLGLSGALGYAGQLGIQAAQQHVEQWVLNWFEARLWRMRDPFRQSTAIGDIGELKQSNRILLRVQADGPLLLREASYSGYFKSTWRAEEAAFAPVPVSLEGRVHFGADAGGNPKQLAVALYLPRGRGLLPLPTAAQGLSLPAGGHDLQGNPYGALKLQQAPELLRYQVFYAESTPLDSPPNQADLRLPSNEEAFLRAQAAELGLPGLPPAQAIARLENFLAQNFSYTLELKRPRLGLTPLEDFLSHGRAGHCEYFATASALLLRAAGIPTRYASGYAVEEFSRLENRYVVRERHAHAWVLVYLDGRWRDLDTTPADWVEQEAARQAGWWQNTGDFFAWLGYLYQRWVWRETGEEKNHAWLLWLVLPLVAFLLWRTTGQRRIKARRQEAVCLPIPGADSPFYRIVEYWQAQGYARQPGENLAAWLNRLPHAPSPGAESTDWQEMLGLHKRYRFDPAGLSAAEKQHLAQRVAAWLEKHAGTASRPG
jgi:hypothetical protein